jgi:hypothetical protein
VLNQWLREHSLSEITVVSATQNGKPLTLEEFSLRSNGFPGVVYGNGQCAVKFKINPQEKYCNDHPQCKEEWERGERVNKYVGYDAGEGRRIAKNQHIYDADKKYRHHFPLFEWGWSREQCADAIVRAGLPLPGKSSCFYCPNNKKEEIVKLWENHPELFARAVNMEHNARKTKKDGTPSGIIGLGRTWAWEQYREKYLALQEAKSNQYVLPGFEDTTGGCCCGMPCGCNEE